MRRRGAVRSVRYRSPAIRALRLSGVMHAPLRVKASTSAEADGPAFLFLLQYRISRSRSGVLMRKTKMGILWRTRPAQLLRSHPLSWPDQSSLAGYPTRLETLSLVFALN